MQKKKNWVRIGAILALCVATVTASPAQTFTVIKHFNGTNGLVPFGPLVEGLDGNLYGTTYAGGANANGTVFRIKTTGALRTLYSFCVSSGCPDGSSPAAGLVLGSTGYFYGVTQVGGANSIGTIFQVKPNGKLTTLYSFCAATDCPDGAQPISGLIQGSDGDFYGTAMDGGANGNFGTVFKYRFFRPSGLTTLHSFCADAGCTDGAFPRSVLVQATDGDFYGTTGADGANLRGTVFRITSDGVLTTLHAFCALPNCADGDGPLPGVVQAANGRFYGTTELGGTSTNCNGGCGTVFRMSSEGKLTTLHSFALSDGRGPNGLVQGTDGNFYGTTELGGAFNKGTIFQMTPDGTLTTLRSLSGSDGTEPTSGMIQATDGNFYGTCHLQNGTVFRLSMGLAPFIKTLATTTTVESPVTILGNNLTGATAVTFSGVPAKFVVVSATQIATAVPADATTGTVHVATPGGTLSSKVAFRVMPQIMNFLPPSGPVGTAVTITGVSLTQTDRVTFDGVAASFTVNSDTQVTANVPTGATSGRIALTTTGGQAKSSTSFTVTP